MLRQFEQYELNQVYAIRVGSVASIWVHQPWEMNRALHQNAYGASTYMPAMIDTSRQPKR